MCGIASVFLGGQDLYTQIIMIKHVYGLSGCHREGLVFSVSPKFLLDVGNAQGVRLRLGKHWVTSRSSHLFFGGVCVVHEVLCSLHFRRLGCWGWGRLSSCH